MLAGRLRPWFVPPAIRSNKEKEVDFCFVFCRILGMGLFAFAMFSFSS